MQLPRGESSRGGWSFMHKTMNIGWKAGNGKSTKTSSRLLLVFILSSIITLNTP